MFCGCLLGTLSISSSLRSANAQSSDLGSLILPGTGIGSAQATSGTLAQNQNFFCNFGSGGTAQLTITKQGGSGTFSINVFNNRASNSVSMSSGSTLSICLRPGTFQVVEIGGTPTYQLSIQSGGGSVTNPSQCSDLSISGGLIPGQTLTCTITNNGISSGGTAQSTSGTTSTTVTGTAQASGGTLSPGSTTATLPGQVGKLTNPPFQACAANLQNKSFVIVNGELTTNNAVTRLPSSATYVISGMVPLDEVRDALQTFNTDTARIVLKSDLVNDDRVLLGLAAPQFTGDILIENSDGVKQKDIPFRVEDVRTECQYKTLAQAFGPAPTRNVAPLGVIGNIQQGEISAPSNINKELIGGIKLGSMASIGDIPLVLNPPFATCQSQLTKPGLQQPDNLALYIIKGTFNDKTQISGHKLTLFLTADLEQEDTDLAKIVKANGNNANNPALVANLIADENQKDAKKIDFTLTDVNTDCKQISLTTDQFFKPLPGEVD